jgi:meiotically up-regulated gene 157 (Mug157) protein
MWLRDSGAQVWPYVRYAAVDPQLRKMIAGVILRQFKLINIDPYANAFNNGPTGDGQKDDVTGSRRNKNVFERKWEIDSHCYPIRLAYAYWKTTGDTSVFDEEWLDAIELTLEVFEEQQRKKGHGDYIFLRETDRQLDTKCYVGRGNPVKPCGLIAPSFRPSDDATTFEFLIPSNFFAVKSLRQAAEILLTVNHQTRLAKECTQLADEVEKALKKHAVVKHPKFGKIYAYEVDGFGNAFMMDDANIPSLLSLPYLDLVDMKDPVYKKGEDVIVLNAQTGLIGRPTMTVNGLELQCLLNPRIDVGSLIQIDNSTIQRSAIDTSDKAVLERADRVSSDAFVSSNGLYRVYSRQFTGDTRGNEWYAKIIAFGVNATERPDTPNLYNTFPNL